MFSLLLLQRFFIFFICRYFFLIIFIVYCSSAPTRQLFRLSPSTSLLYRHYFSHSSTSFGCVDLLCCLLACAQALFCLLQRVRFALCSSHSFVRPLSHSQTWIFVWSIKLQRARNFEPQLLALFALTLFRYMPLINLAVSLSLFILSLQLLNALSAHPWISAACHAIQLS